MCTSETQCTPQYISYVPKRKIDFSTIPVYPTSPILSTRRNKNITLPVVLNTEKTSPILNSRKKEQNCSTLTSPVLHTNTNRRKTSSPVINNKEIITLRKQRILESNRKSNCVRKLQYECEEPNIPTVEEFDVPNKKFTLNFHSEHVKEPEQNKPIKDLLKTSLFNENFKKRKRKRNPRNNYKKIKTCDENIVIETVCSQEIADQIENSIIEKLESPRNIFKNVSFSKNNRKIEEKLKDEIELVCSQVEETGEIEMIHSQEICRPSEMFAGTFQPRNEITEEVSQNSYTQKSTVIETDLTQSDPKVIIEETNSQTSSTLTNISNCTVVQDSFEKSSEEYIWSPIKKKKYKPGTYSHKLQRIIRKQKANTAIWKHELYLAKCTNYAIPVSEEDLKITIVEICKINTDYGMNILEGVEMESKEKCLIIADVSQLFDDTVLRIKDLIKIYPPFLINYIKIDQCDIKTFVNVHKILKC